MAQTHSLDLELSSSQYASIADASQTGLDVTTGLTVEAWFKLESLPSSGAYYIIANKGGISVAASDTTFQYSFWYDNDGSRRLQCGIRGAGVTKTAVYAVTLETGVWYHVAMTYTGGTSLKLYLNGREVASNTSSIPASLVDTARPFGIGADQASGTIANYFDGLIKDVRVFNDARTQAEIVADAHTENVTDANLVGEWNLNNAYTDSSGNGNTLTASGSPVFATDFPWDAPSGADGSAHLETNLISWWTMNEVSGTREDSHGVNDLTDNNTVASAAGKIGNAADFELSNSEYLSITDAAQSGLDISGSFSFSAWMKLEQLPSTAAKQFGVFSKYLASGDLRAYEAYILPSADGASAADGIEIVVSADGTTANIDAKGMSAALFVSGDVGNWVHIVLTYNISTRTFRAYKNGIEQLTTTRASSGTLASIFNNARAFELGRNNEDSANTTFDGMMDEVAMYARVLDYGNVLDLYNAGAGISYSGAQTFDQALDASVSAAASMLTPKTILQALSASASGSASLSMINAFVRTLDAAVTATGAVLKGMSLTLGASASVVASLTAERVYLVTMNALTSVAASLTKTHAYVRTLGATATATASMAKQIATSMVLEAEATVTATLDLVREITLQAAVSTAATMTTAIGKTLTVTATITAKILAPFWRTKYPAHGDDEDYEIKYPHD